MTLEQLFISILQGNQYKGGYINATELLPSVDPSMSRTNTHVCLDWNTSNRLEFYWLAANINNLRHLDDLTKRNLNEL